MAEPEEVVMTPSKSGKKTTIQIEKKSKREIDATKVAHTGGGQHTGIVINKQGQVTDLGPVDIQLEFKCFLIDQKSGNQIPESRLLKFWFREGTDYLDKVTGAYEFFKELVKPEQFPRDYVGFIKRIMKQVQIPRYHNIKKVDVDMEPLDPSTLVAPEPEPPSKDKKIVVQESVLHTLESAFPNILHLDDLSQMTKADENLVREQIEELKARDLVKEMEPGQFVRKVQIVDKSEEVKVVKNMPMQTAGEKPTIAIITSKYYEKVAVDSMMEEKTTFVRYKTEGESNVYTIGYIGPHKCVSTKLPQLGRAMAAQISSGNTTTRLLGTFSDVEHVLLVGVAGGVPHYTDFYKHVRLGDVVVGSLNEKGYMYIFCDQVMRDEAKGTLQYMLKGWQPRDNILQELAAKIRDQFQANPGEDPMHQYIKEKQIMLSGQEVSFERPPAETDKLYMSLGGSDMIEVGHPPVPEELQGVYIPGAPRVQFGTFAAGKPVAKEEPLRLDFSTRHGCIGFDMEYDQVLESIVGNRKDSFLFVRGITDYLDGSTKKEWQPYSSLVAAAYMKALITQLPK